jgi:nucleoside-diphosphate-sugar epimerase
MKVLVTGASGFVGSRTADLLCRLGHEVVRATGPGSEQQGSISIDVTSESSLAELERIEGIDAVVNCAGIAHRFGGASDETLVKVNANGAANIARLATRVGAKLFIQVSSVSVYRKASDANRVSESGELSTDGGYAKSKVLGEKAVTNICEAAHIDLTILRPVSVVGEGDPGNVGRLIRAIDRGRFIWVGDGQNLKSLLYVEDLARAVVTSMTVKDSGSIYNVVGGTISVDALVSEISQHLGKDLPRVRVPRFLAMAGLYVSYPLSQFPLVASRRRSLETWLSDSVFSGDRFRQECGFKPETDISEGIKREVEAYLSTR